MINVTTLEICGSEYRSDHFLVLNKLHNLLMYNWVEVS